LSHTKRIKYAATVGYPANWMVTKGHRRLGRTIRKLENSVELSSKESYAKEDAKKHRPSSQNGYDSDDSPVENLRDLALRKKSSP
jgi:hypothetical protein